MNTGTPNGGGSSHGSNPTSNICLPIKTAPVEECISCTIASSVSSSRRTSSRKGDPPRHPPFPTRTFGPVTNPSIDIESSETRLLIAAFLIA